MRSIAEVAVRPTVHVFDVEGKPTTEVALPDVFKTQVRSDIVHFVHSQIAMNHRQAYAVKADAGMESPAESWGPGRAVARVPRVPGSGTGAAAQGAFGNMCRGGHMYSPNTTLRKWHRKVNVAQKRFAVASALAAAAVPAFVQSRGHKIAKVAELPLVVSTEVESFKKTSQAVKLLEKLNAMDDVTRAANSTNERSGLGKMRNRRYITRRGPLVVYNEDNGVVKAFRNLPGVTLARVDALNLLDLAPGSHMGRFVIFTEAAFAKLNALFGTVEKSAELKKGFHLPAAVATTGDFHRLVHAEEIQRILRAPVATRKYHACRRNALTNKAMKVRLNPALAK